MTQPLTEYFEALERLKNDCSIHVPKGAKITNDAVALEAGRGKGSIKKSRPVFSDLIMAINAAAAEQAKGANWQREKFDKAKATAIDCRRQLEASIAREVSLLYELYAVKKQLAELTGSNVLPLRPKEK